MMVSGYCTHRHVRLCSVISTHSKCDIGKLVPPHSHAYPSVSQYKLNQGGVLAMNINYMLSDP
jgi:hypothetical protein